jgi:hypothetical protein
MKRAVLLAAGLLIAATAADAADLAAFDPTGRAPLPDGTLPKIEPLPPMQLQSLGAPNYASDPIDLLPGTAGAPLYDPNGSLPAPINPDSRPSS